MTMDIRLHGETCRACGEARPKAVPTLSQNLADRALAGWQRFLSSFKESANE
ncbi:hypothetical protein ACQKM2_37275 [Streptomyces sp. NPDC004126]|uniref:hypothetical protein n=1 Tax=Streptomyces sp. NPDC004126 TaxID=3390695 RepID=UPI003D07EEAA